jgi:hypothetical protein
MAAADQLPVRLGDKQARIARGDDPHYRLDTRPPAVEEVGFRCPSASTFHSAVGGLDQRHNGFRVRQPSRAKRQRQRLATAWHNGIIADEQSTTDTSPTPRPRLLNLAPGGSDPTGASAG